MVLKGLSPWITADVGEKSCTSSAGVRLAPHKILPRTLRLFLYLDMLKLCSSRSPSSWPIWG